MKGLYKMNKSLLLASMMVVALAACGKKRHATTTRADACARSGSGASADTRAGSDIVCTCRCDEV